MTAKPTPPPFEPPACLCGHPMGVHQVSGAERKRHACSAGLGPGGTSCGCRAYAPVVTP
jgi:hypothetical protein